MNSPMLTILFALTAILAVFFFLLSLRRLGTRTTFLAVLFSGVALLILTIALESSALRMASAAFGLFVVAFSVIKIVRKMY